MRRVAGGQEEETAAADGLPGMPAESADSAGGQSPTCV